MSALFLRALNMSIAAGWTAAAVILLRFLLKKAPRRAVCALWLLVAVRLVCPVSLESAFSLLPTAETVPESILYSAEPKIDSGFTAMNTAVGAALTQVPEKSGVSLETLTAWAAGAWLLGAALMLSWGLYSYLRLRRRAAASLETERDVWEGDEVGAPFILGVIRPRIYLPSGLEDRTRRFVLAHERTHLRRGDQLWKPLGFCLLAVYWFNPLLWLAYAFLCKDIEFACDEQVVGGLAAAEKADYAQALLDCSLHRRWITACPLAFGEVSVKERVSSVLNYKKPAFWVTVTALTVCAAAAVCFLTDPKAPQEAPPVNDGPYWVNALVGYDGSLNDREDEYSAPQYFIRDGVLMWNRAQEGGEASSAWTELGALTPFSVKAADMEKLLAEPFAWEVGFSPETVCRAGTGYRVEAVWKGEKLLFWLLPQENGTILLCRGDGTPKLHWIQLLGRSEPAAHQQIQTVGNDLLYTWTAAWAGYTEDRTIWTEGENGDRPVLDSRRDLPVYRLNTPEELAAFRDRWRGTLAVDTGLDDMVPSFDQATALFDQSHFQTHTVFAVYLPVSSTSDRYGVDHLGWDGQTLSIRLRQTTELNSGDTAMGGFWFFISTEKEVGLSASAVEAAAEPNLRAQYPGLFDLDTAYGLDVYVYQMAENTYSCKLLPGTDGESGLVSGLIGRPSVSLEDMKTILASYGLDPADVRVHLWQNPISSYLSPWSVREEGESGEEYDARCARTAAELRRMLGLSE